MKSCLAGLLAGLLALAAPRAGRPHSITVVPMARNAIDRLLPLWKDGSAPLSDGGAGTAATGKDAAIGLCNETCDLTPLLCSVFFF